MRFAFIVWYASLCLALVGCAKPPLEEINAARRVGSSDALAALEQELTDQGDKFALFRSYTRAKDIAAGIVADPFVEDSAEGGAVTLRGGAVTLKDCTCTCGGEG